MALGLKVKINNDIESIFEALGIYPNQVRFIGGYVRDQILGKKSKDIDIATIYKPLEVIEKLKLKGIKTLPTGIKFGTVTAIVNNKYFEITTLRKDLNQDGRHTQVEYTDDWQIDSTRRDFTINAISCSLSGEIFDYHNGIDDLKNKIVKFIGNAEERILEDHLRIVRFFRFSNIYAKEFDQETLNIIKNNSHLLKKISGERIQSEFLKILQHNDISKTIGHIEYANILPNIAVLNYNLSEQFIKLFKIKQLTGVFDLTIRLYLLAKDNIENFSKTWRLSNKIYNELNFIESNKNILKDKSEKEIKDILFKFGHTRFIYLIFLAAIDDFNHIQFYTEIYNSLKNIPIPIFSVNGNDIKALGINDGKEIGKLLTQAKNIWIESDYLFDKKQILKELSI